MCTHFIKIWDGCAKKHERNMGESRNHEWTRMGTNRHELFNHEKHEIHEKEKGERVRTTNGQRQG